MGNQTSSPAKGAVPATNRMNQYQEQRELGRGMLWVWRGVGGEWVLVAVFH